MRDTRVGSVQFQHRDADKQANLQTIGTFTEQAAREGVEMLIFPECCITGYWFLRNLSRDEITDLAEPIGRGASCKALLELAQQHQMTIGAGLVELADDGSLYNTYVVAMPDGGWSSHRKIHCFVSGHMSSGSDYTVFDAPNGCKVGVLICYDCNLGENVRITALKGAEILLAPHQTGGCDTPDKNTMGLVDRRLWDNRTNDPQAIENELKGDKGRAWLMRWLPARAHDNGIFLIFSNGVGQDDNEIRTGNAMILDPYGRVLTETCKAGDDLVMADLDASLLENSTGNRWIRTRRPELYNPLVKPTGREMDTRTLRFDGKGV